MTTQTEKLEVLEIIEKMIIEKNTSWKDIVTKIKETHKINNWLNVRGVLQILIDENTIRRTNNLSIEVYELA